MTKDQFLNAMRLLWNLDEHELVEAGVLDGSDPGAWGDFVSNPHRWAARVDDETMDKLWALMRKRSQSLDLAVAEHEDRVTMIPDVYAVATRNPVNQVYFRAGLLACREYMARFVEQGGDKTTAQSIRANWWPELGPDPGPPRLFDFAEICDEIEGPDGKVSWKSKDVSPSIEALPRAYQFLLPPVVSGDPAEPRQD